jgi:hypothetical protein
MANGIVASVDPSKKAEVKLHFHSLAARSKRCYEWSKWKLSGQDGKKYNFLDYVGTNRVVGDIDAFRRAVGAPTMSMIGASYGTLVTGMYASMLPDKVDKLMMNSAMDPRLDAVTLAKQTADGLARSTRRLLQDCSAQPGCSLHNDGNPAAALHDLYRRMRVGSYELAAPQDPVGNATQGRKFHLTAGLLTSWLLKHLSDNSGAEWRIVADVLGDLTDDSRKVRSQAVATVLNEMCSLAKEGQTIFTWKYGACIGNQVEESDTLLQAIVSATDYAGRYTVDQATDMAMATYSELGESASAFIGYLSNMFAWPILPQPAGTIGNPWRQAVVVSNLYDPVTAYTSSQAMHQAFPAGSMVTWQGVGHIFEPDIVYDEDGAAACNEGLTNFMKTGKLPQNGQVCLNKNALPLTPEGWKPGDDETDDSEDETDEDRKDVVVTPAPTQEAKSGGLRTQVSVAMVPMLALAWLL